MKISFLLLMYFTIVFSISQINGQSNILNKLLKIIELGKRVMLFNNKNNNNYK
jgi:hypothetical protein